MTAAAAGVEPSAHVDTFARDNLPPQSEWPDLCFTLPELQYPGRLNAGRVLVDDAVTEGWGDKAALYQDALVWTYSDLLRESDRIAHVLVREEGLLPGNRVLLMAPNSLMLAAAWLAVLRAGAIAVTAMPLLRAKELNAIARKARIDHVLCDSRLLAEISEAARESGYLNRIRSWNSGDLENAMVKYAAAFAAVDTAADDVALLAFTSGTTGNPKATMHFHRDVLAMADVVARHLLKTAPDDVYVGSPPLGFTFGLGALLVFPLKFRAAAAYIERPNPSAILAAVERFRATALFTAPTLYRGLVGRVDQFDLSSLRICISAGEALSRETSDAWHAATGLRLIDGIGATEMIHIFIGASGADIRPGATGKPLPGYQAVVLDDQGVPAAVGSGLLAVKGPTGCRYLDDERQREYVRNGWNVTGDYYRIDSEGYFWFESRVDDMIVSSGYNIAGPEVEGALLQHAAVDECAVVGSPDPERGNIVKAFVVLKPHLAASQSLIEELQAFVKGAIAPYKYPRTIEFVASLPRTSTGKVQRFTLRERERGRGLDAG